MAILNWLVAVALVFLIPGPGRAQALDSAPQPLGRLVDVGGYRVHLYCLGNGSPTVVIAGAGYSFDWGLVQPEVAKFTRVCAYDHSGIAWSDPGPTDSCSLRVREIHAALESANIAGPYVLVGYSLGALVSRLYASKYEEEVVGMVIVDHAMESVFLRADGSSVTSPPRPPSPPPATRLDLNAGFEKLPERDYRLHVWANLQPGVWQIMDRNWEMNAECRNAVEAATQNRASPLGDKPLIAVSQSGTMQLHTQLLTLSTNSKQMVAKNSSHYVMVDRPDVVIGAIREVVEAARNHISLKD